MDYGLCQTLGNKVSIQHMQSSTELWKLSAANRFSSFISLTICYYFEEGDGLHKASWLEAAATWILVVR